MQPFSVLTVCVGNVCRSPLAERLLSSRLLEGGAPMACTVLSAGVRAVQGAPMHPRVQAALEDLGGTADHFVARQLTEAMVREADLVLTATQAVRTRVLEDVPSGLRRTFTILDFAALANGASPGLSPAGLVDDACQRRSSLSLSEHDVPDPIGGSQDLFATVASQLDVATRTISGAFASCRS